MRTLVKTYNPHSFLFDNLFGKDINDIFTPAFAGLNNVPAANIVENENGFRLEIAAAGLKKEDFKLHLENNVLTVSAKVEKTNEESNEKFTRKEFGYQSFSRAFTLPNSANSEQIVANYVDGILKVEIPKKEEAKAKEPRQIEVV